MPGEWSKNTKEMWSRSVLYFIVYLYLDVGYNGKTIMVLSFNKYCMICKTFFKGNNFWILNEVKISQVTSIITNCKPVKTYVNIYFLTFADK